MSFMILSSVSALNYYFLSIAQSSEVALIAQKNIYAVMLFFPIIFLSILCELCKSRREVFQDIITVCAFVLIVVIITTEKTGLFYQEYTLDPVTHEISKVYGVFHTIYFVYLAFVFFLTIFVVILNRKKNTNPVTSISLVILMEITLVISIYFGDVINVNFNFDAVGMVIINAMMLYLARRIPLYDVSSMVIERIENDREIGIITSDMKHHLLGYNSVISNIIPELERCRVDFPLDEPFPYANMFSSMSNEYDEKGIPVKKEVEISGRWYSFELSSLMYLGRQKGYQLFVRDISEKNRYIHMLETYREELLQEIESKISQINLMQDASLLGIAELIESRDGSTGGHVKRTSRVVEILSQSLSANHVFDVSPLFYTIVAKVAPLHDIGKIAIDDAILRKPGRFTPEEFELMKRHAEIGGKIIEKILQNIENKHWITIAANIASYHHEKWNGTGYPCRLSGTNIPLESRIMAVADVYDALVSKRCYKDSYDFKAAYDIIMDGMGTQFDPQLKEVFQQCAPQLEAYYSQLRLEEG